MLLNNRSMRYIAGNICLVLLTAFIFTAFTGASAFADDIRFKDTQNNTKAISQQGYNLSISLESVTDTNFGTKIAIPSLSQYLDGSSIISGVYDSIASVVYSVYEFTFTLTGVPSGGLNLNQVPVYVYNSQDEVLETVYLDLDLDPPESSSGGGGSYIPPTEETSPVDDSNVKTSDDAALNESLKEDGEAKVSLADKAEPKAVVSPKVIEQLATAAKPLVIENEGVKLDFAAQSLVTEELKEVLADENATVELGAREVAAFEKAEILAKAKLGESTGLFEIGGKVVDLTAQVTRKNADGTTSSNKIDSFAEPVAVTIDLSDAQLSDEEIANLTGVRYEKAADGTIVPVKLGGSYDPVTKKFTFYTDKFSLYSVVKASKLTKINLGINRLNPTVNGEEVAIDVPPTILNNRTMVPLRFIGESFGAQVDWFEETRTVTINLDGEEINLVIGQTQPGLDVPATIIAGRTLVPLRYISENLGSSVMWFPSTRSIEVVR